jgi:hypothetical protein
MSDKVGGLGAATDSTYGHGQAPAAPADLPDRGAVDAPEGLGPADLRLLIEEDKTEGGLVYMTIDGRTGAVVRKIPREQLLRMREAKTYAAGQLIKTRA